jgi:hypothetical protein
MRCTVLLLICAAVGAGGGREERSCYSRPADFMPAENWWKGRPPPVQLPPKNVIKVFKSGAVTWNDVELRSLHGWVPLLDQYLQVVPEMKPPPFIFVDWEQGAPCTTIDQVRKLMRDRLHCDGSASCLQGAAPY